MNDTAPAAAPRPRPGLRHAAGVIAILLVAALLRFWGLGDKALWLDEVMSLRLATQPTVADLLSSVRAYDAHPPLYALVHFAWMRPAPLRWQRGGIEWRNAPGRVDGYTRVPSAIFGVAAVAAMMLLGGALYGPRLGLAAGGLLALSAYHVYFSQEARPYALLVLLTLGLTYVFVRLLQQPGPRRGSWWPPMWCWRRPVSIPTC